MPHLIVEYSANLEKRIDIPDLVRKVHTATLATGVFDPASVRTRAERREHYAIADGHPDNSFVAVSVRIASGRDAETRKRIGKTIFDSLCGYLAPVYEASPIGISLEVQDMDTVEFRKNNLPVFVKERAAKAPA
jgi:5-carboxymethyl-2-hydroxymuconate isomerase